MTFKRIVFALALVCLGASSLPSNAAAVQLYSNNAVTTLAANASSSTTTLTVASSTAFPTLSGGNWFIATLEHLVSGVVTVDEIVKVTAVSGTTWTVVRAQEGTAGVSWLSGDTVALLPTSGGMAQFLQPGSSPTITGSWTFSSTINGNASTATTATNLASTSGCTGNFATGITTAGVANCSNSILGSGLVVGSPTGGNLGAGTVNAQNLYVNGTAVATTAVSTGAWNPTFTGFSTPPSGTDCYWSIVIDNVHVECVGAPGTSSSNSMSITNVPPQIQAATAQWVTADQCENAGATAMCTVLIEGGASAATWLFNNCIVVSGQVQCGPNNWATTGNKGFLNIVTFNYSLAH